MCPDRVSLKTGILPNDAGKFMARLNETNHISKPDHDRTQREKQPYTLTGERHQCFIYPCTEPPPRQRKPIGTDQYKFSSSKSS